MSGGGLRRRLGVVEVVGLRVGAMIGGTIYAGTGIAMVLSGGAADFAYLVAACLAFLVAYSYVVLCEDFADSGGSYSFVSGVLGVGVGAVTSFLQLVAYTVASAFYAVMAAEYLRVSLNVPRELACPLLLAVVTGLNVVGAKENGLVQAFVWY